MTSLKQWHFVSIGHSSLISVKLPGLCLRGLLTQGLEADAGEGQEKISCKFLVSKPLSMHKFVQRFLKTTMENTTFIQDLLV